MAHTCVQVKGRLLAQEGRSVPPPCFAVAAARPASGRLPGNVHFGSASAPRVCTQGPPAIPSRKSIRARFNSTDKQAPDFEASVEEIMGPVAVQLSTSTPCKDAARLLLQHDISSAPVVDDAGKLVGILSETDLLWKGAGAPLDHTIVPPVFVGAFDLLISLRDSTEVKKEIEKILARTVGQAMSKSPASIGPGASLSQAASMMLSKKVHSLPVVDTEGKVIGWVTQHDVLRGMVAEQLPLL